ncbi:S-formylglutathione hydrolase [Enterococcus sp. AZ109]|uniref:S-formylglutathione hydrolase n=1 Tax=Enterococcus sp. AZ109 TaxID=2774634 RepID=UPI003F1FFFB6
MTVEILETHRSFGGKQIKYRHTSKSLKCEMTFSLFLPAETPDKKATPLIWWLSGLTCTDDNFSQKAAFQKYAAEQNIAFVMPDTSPRGETADSEDWDLGQGAGFYLNATQDPWKENFQMYDYLIKELPEIVYPLLPNFSGKESIMGHSMGGHGALVLGLKNPKRFAAISAFAPISNPSNVPWGKKAFTAYLGEDPSAWIQWDATEILKTVDENHPPILVTQGTDDPFYEVQLKEEAFLAAAKVAGGEVIYQKERGYDHSYFTIATFIEAHIAFHQAQLNK